MQTLQEMIAAHRPLKSESLIPILQEVQSARGYLSSLAMEEISQALRLPVSRVYGVATFYKQFRFIPLCEHVIQVCRGTACHVKGSLKIADHMKRRLKLKPDGNSRDGKFTLITVACLGACSIAPVMKLDGEFYGHLTLKKLDQLIDEAEGGK